MIGMTSKKLFDSLAIEFQLLLNCKEHLYQAQGQQALCFDRWLTASQFGGMGEDLHASRPLVATPQPPAVKKLLPLAPASLSQRVGSGETLQKHPSRHRSPILEGFQGSRIIFGQRLAQLLN